MSLECEINGLIANSEFPEDTAIFASNYGAFNNVYRTFLDWDGTDCGDAADLESLRGMLPMVESQIEKVNFLAKALCGYPVNLVQPIDVDAAREIEENYQLHAFLNIQMAAIDNGYFELSWMVSENGIHVFEAIHDHWCDKTESDSPKAA